MTIQTDSWRGQAQAAQVRFVGCLVHTKTETTKSAINLTCGQHTARETSLLPFTFGNAIDEGQVFKGPALRVD